MSLVPENFDPECIPIAVTEGRFKRSILGAGGPFWLSKPLFAPSVCTLPPHPATQNLNRLVPELEQALLRAGCVPSGPQTRVRRNVARGVEVLRGTPHHVIARDRGRQS